MYRSLLVVGALAVVACAVPTTALASDPVIVSGHLSVPPAGGADPDSGPVIAGSVGLYLPADTDESADDTFIADGSTAPDGSFSLAVPYTPEIAAAAAANDGQINFNLLANVDGWVYHEAITRQYLEGSWLDEDGAVPPHVYMSPDNLTRYFNMIPGADGGAETGTTPYGVGACGIRRTAVASWRAWTTIGELHNASDVRESSFTYGYKADSHISKAYSVDGSVWKLKGTVKVGNESGSGTSGEVVQLAPYDNWAREIESEFIYTKYRVEMWCSASGVQWTDWEIRPRRWVGSIRPGADLSNLDGRCLEDHFRYYATYGRNSVFTRETNRYHAFSRAASLSVGGPTVSLNARSGLSRWVRVRWRFGDAIPAHYLCGTDDFPPRARRIFAGA